MTVSTVVDHNDYTGNGVTTSFPYTFRIFKKTDLTVSVIDLSENITVLGLDTDYTVTNAGGYNGGSVVLTTPLANGWQISISRELEPTQETDLRNQGKFFAEVHEDAFDKLTMLIQQVSSLFRLALRKPSSIANWYDALNNYIRNLKDPRDPQDAATKNYTDNLVGSNFNRTLRVPESSIPQLPPANLRANMIQGFDSAGNPVMLVPQSGSAADVMLQLASTSAGKGAALVASKQPFANAVARNQLDINNEYVSVKDFGAKGDMSADDTAAIKAAIAAAASYSNRAASVYFPGGFYNVSSTIELPSWVQLVGSGIETTQIRCTNTDAGHIILLPNGTQYNGIRGMTVRYATVPTSGGIGIGIKSYHPYFWQIKVTECYIGIKIYENDYAVSSNATGVFVEQFQINDCSYVGLMVGNSNSGFCNDITFRDGLMLTDNPDYFHLGGIRIIGRVESLTMTNIDMIGGRLPYTADAGSTEGLRFSTFTGVFFDSGAARCEFGRMRHCQFTNCWISGGRTNGTEGAYFTDVQNTTFAGLRVYNCGSSGLVFDNCSYINIVEGSFGLNNANGLSASQWHMQFGSTCSHFTVQNCTSNRASGTIAAGVRVESGSTYYTITGNHFGQVTAPISEGNSSAQGRFVADNAFYNTYAAGSGILASGTTSTTVSHGLAVVPQIKQVRIQQNGASVTPLYVQSVNGTNITVATQTSNSGAAPFTWEVDATRY